MSKKWSQDLKYKNNVSIKERKEKIHKILTTSLISTLPLTKCPILTLPLNMTTLIYQNYFPFLSRVTKGRVSSKHLIGRASISIIIILRSIIVITIIIIKIRTYKRWWRGSLVRKSVHGRLSSSNTAKCREDKNFLDRSTRCRGGVKIEIRKKAWKLDR